MKRLKKVSLVIAALGLVIGYGVLLWKGPWLFDGSHVRKRDLQPADGVVITGFRTMVVAVGAGTIAAIGLWYTHKSHRQTEELFRHTRRKDQDQADLTREGQVTGRYVEAIKLLASDKLHERLGGIYALERVMADSDRDHRTIVEVLSAFVRTKLQEETVKDSADGEAAEVGKRRTKRRSAGTPLRTLNEDVKAALTVLSRRDPAPRRAVPAELFGIHLADHDLVGLSWESVNLERANLQGAKLKKANLDGATLDHANLDCATLTGVSMRGASLDGALMASADLVRADLSDACLSNARMSHAIMNNVMASGARLIRAGLDHASLNDANLNGAELTRARLGRARLRNADLRRADLEHAELKQANLEAADFAGARLFNVDLEGANLRKAKLGEAQGLTEHMLMKARIYRSTVLPPEFVNSAVLKDRIEDIEAMDAAEEEAALNAALAEQDELLIWPEEASDER
ncbi:pentapeptide repeat-containing protein (plasmid) [Streptomyces hygroscopicus subsp. jinggangensis 5008]|nr:pentapeptide repeat-containing protein [Streptomyces hygroscopicus subsp. jinggangensis 5008]AGF68347.1 pentapeptide repeat-containing protein [Streptomyces hygroscopicus subsp. jinggangensis TL01]